MLTFNTFRLVAIPAGLALFAVAAAPLEAQACQPRTDAPGRECFVSRAGNDANPGTIARPFRTIARGVECLSRATCLACAAALYVESVRIADKHGTGARPIVVRSYPGEHAYIDGSLPQFRTLNNDDWEPVGDGGNDCGYPAF